MHTLLQVCSGLTSVGDLRRFHWAFWQRGILWTENFSLEGAMLVLEGSYQVRNGYSNAITLIAHGRDTAES